MWDQRDSYIEMCIVEKFNLLVRHLKDFPNRADSSFAFAADAVM